MKPLFYGSAIFLLDDIFYDFFLGIGLKVPSELIKSVPRMEKGKNAKNIETKTNSKRIQSESSQRERRIGARKGENHERR